MMAIALATFLALGDSYTIGEGADEHERWPVQLAKALRDYKSAARKNPIMAGFAATLSPKDIENVAAYYGSQPPVLVVKR